MTINVTIIKELVTMVTLVSNYYGNNTVTVVTTVNGNCTVTMVTMIRMVDGNCYTID